MNLFPDLQSVHIHGRNWNSKVVLPLVLMSATKISKLQLMNMSSRQSMDPAWTRILASNKMAKLTSVSLYSGCYVSISMVRKLTLECPKLTFLSVLNFKKLFWGPRCYNFTKIATVLGLLEGFRKYSRTI